MKQVEHHVRGEASSNAVTLAEVLSALAAPGLNVAVMPAGAPARDSVTGAVKLERENRTVSGAVPPRAIVSVSRATDAA